MSWSAINDEKDHALGAGRQSFQKLNEHIGVDAAFSDDHEPHVTARSDRRYQTHPMTRARRLDNRRLAFLAPCAAGVMIGTHVRRVAKINVSADFLRTSGNCLVEVSTLNGNGSGNGTQLLVTATDVAQTTRAYQTTRISLNYVD